MTTEKIVKLQCSCGKVQGEAIAVTPSKGTRVICRCDDCQTYAHALGRADELLDEHGGTDIYQLWPAQLRINEGHDLIRCLRLRPNGLMRWHTSCCKTPVANTLSKPGIPFAGIPHLLMNHGQAGRSDDLGPVIATVNCRSVDRRFHLMVTRSSHRHWQLARSVSSSGAGSNEESNHHRSFRTVNLSLSPTS